MKMDACFRVGKQLVRKLNDGCCCCEVYEMASNLSGLYAGATNIAR
jgi:hypothetical protein